MSRRKGYGVCRNELSLLLALLRRRITTHQFRLMVRMLQAADLFRRKRSLVPREEERWLRYLSASVREVEASLNRGSFYRSELDRLLHLVAHLFLLPCEIDSSRPGQPRDRTPDPSSIQLLW